MIGDVQEREHVVVLGEPTARELDDHLEWFPIGHRRGVFIYLVVVNLIVQYDTGALAALVADDTEDGIVAAYKLTGSEQGFLSGAAHLGIAAGCAASGYLLRHYTTKRLLEVSAVINTLTAWLFALSPNLPILFTTRIINGISQAILVVYAPIWADEFAPPSKKSTWMSVCEAGGPIGVVLGYLIAGLVVENLDLKWQWAFFIQGTLLVPLTVLIFFINPNYLQVHDLELEKVLSQKDTKSLSIAMEAFEAFSDGPRDSEGSNPPQTQPPTTVPSPRETAVSANSSTRHTPLLTVLKTPLVWSSVLALSSLYFVVTGMQMWITDYLTGPDSPIQADYNTVVICFGFCAATGPVAGVIVGGMVLDKLGGYREGCKKSAFVAAGFGFFAMGIAFITLCLEDFIPFIICIWLLLFMGGGIVPSVMGIVVGAVEKHLRPVTLSFTKFTSTILGFFLGPFACGVVADFWGLKWGFRVVLGWAAMAEVFLITTCVLVRKENTVCDIEEEEPAVVRSLRASFFGSLQGVQPELTEMSRSRNISRSLSRAVSRSASVTKGNDRTESSGDPDYDDGDNNDESSVEDLDAAECVSVTSSP